MLIQSAVKLKDGTMFYGERHGEILKIVHQKYEISLNDLQNAIQGFVDEDNKFYTRSEAEIYAKKVGQLNTDIIGSELTSEDLW